MNFTKGTGPCAKVRVFCTLVHPDSMRWYGENVVRKPQATCPRGNMPSGMGYDLCINVCDQVGHAEVVALTAAGSCAEGCTAYIEGRDYICMDCQSALLKAGVNKWVIGAPPKPSLLQRFVNWLDAGIDRMLRDETADEFWERQW